MNWMKRKIIILFLISIAILAFKINIVFAQAVSLSYFPSTVLQGDPILVQINGITKVSLIKKLTFGGKKVDIFMYQNKPSALVGIDLNKKVGTYELRAELTDGSILKKNVDVALRYKTEAPLGIPEKLGGNTKKSQEKLIASLVAENKSLTNIKTSSKALWTDKFMPPLKELFIIDPYGNSRKTGVYSIPHKGVDYRAKIGIEVMAVNSGVVRITQSYRDYGKTIVIDHGLGLMTFYLHLSKIKVKVGDVVKRGQIIGLSGDTGYTQGAHLHLSIRINGIGIDPVKFFDLFK